MPRSQAVNLHFGVAASSTSSHHDSLFDANPQRYGGERERLGVWLKDGRYATRAVVTRHTEAPPAGLYEDAAAKKPLAVRAAPTGTTAQHALRALPPPAPLVRRRTAKALVVGATPQFEYQQTEVLKWGRSHTSTQQLLGSLWQFGFDEAPAEPVFVHCTTNPCQKFGWERAVSTKPLGGAKWREEVDARLGWLAEPLGPAHFLGDRFWVLSHGSTLFPTVLVVYIPDMRTILPNDTSLSALSEAIESWETLLEYRLSDHHTFESALKAYGSKPTAHSASFQQFHDYAAWHTLSTANRDVITSTAKKQLRAMRSADGPGSHAKMGLQAPFLSFFEGLVLPLLPFIEANYAKFVPSRYKAYANIDPAFSIYGTGWSYVGINIFADNSTASEQPCVSWSGSYDAESGLSGGLYYHTDASNARLQLGVIAVLGAFTGFHQVRSRPFPSQQPRPSHSHCFAGTALPGFWDDGLHKALVAALRGLLGAHARGWPRLGL